MIMNCIFFGHQSVYHRLLVLVPATIFKLLRVEITQTCGKRMVCHSCEGIAAKRSSVERLGVPIA